MTTLKVSIPIYKLCNYSRHEVDGEVQVFTYSDNLADGYEQLLPQIEHLLEKVQSQSRIAGTLYELEIELCSKQQELERVTLDIRRAKKQYQRLKTFLGQFGVDVADSQLRISNASFLSLDLPPDEIPVEIFYGDDDDDDDDDDSLSVSEF